MGGGPAISQTGTARAAYAMDREADVKDRTGSVAIAGEPADFFGSAS